MHIDKYLDVKKLDALLAHVRAQKGDFLRDAEIKKRELTLLARAKDIRALLIFLRDDRACQFKMLMDVCGADYPEREARFDVVYHLLSLTHNIRVRVKIQAAEGQSVPSVSDVFACANWYERETYDMFGIPFENHPDLRRILTDYDFDGFPLRKDFPVEGKVEMFYDAEQKRCVYRPTDLKQSYRHFEWTSPWEGMDDPYALAAEDNTFSRDDFGLEKAAKTSGELK